MRLAGVTQLKPQWPKLQTGEVQGRMGRHATRQGSLPHYSMWQAQANETRWPMCQAEEVLGSQANWPTAMTWRCRGIAMAVPWD